MHIPFCKGLVIMVMSHIITATLYIHNTPLHATTSLKIHHHIHDWLLSCGLILSRELNHGLENKKTREKKSNIKIKIRNKTKWIKHSILTWVCLSFVFHPRVYIVSPCASITIYSQSSRNSPRKSRNSLSMITRNQGRINHVIRTHQLINRGCVKVVMIYIKIRHVSKQ